MKAMRLLMTTSALVVAEMAHAQEGEPIKVGVLHSLSGTMAISETTLKDTVLLMVERQNAKGGVLPPAGVRRRGPCLRLAALRRKGS